MILLVASSAVAALEKEKSYKQLRDYCISIGAKPPEREKIEYHKPVKENDNLNPIYVLLAFIFGLSL